MRPSTAIIAGTATAVTAACALDTMHSMGCEVAPRHSASTAVRCHDFAAAPQPERPIAIKPNLPAALSTMSGVRPASLALWLLPDQAVELLPPCKRATSTYPTTTNMKSIGRARVEDDGARCAQHGWARLRADLAVAQPVG